MARKAKGDNTPGIEVAARYPQFEPSKSEQFDVLWGEFVNPWLWTRAGRHRSDAVKEFCRCGHD
ncbi:hypothetical protein IVB14_29630 [Bradyrhizobium sp. 180]|uniref:hypothetical protein n=1 Tax=Bradyrhizobium sp. 180 TaxID=2782650 RepID=UPI001FF82EC3|nr:hypothetical protein [Bradyrhizobium sp. 180]MCK1494458.1 hypothetical protein [Bradyrhizobium sp. 180]